MSEFANTLSELMNTDNTA